MPGNCSSTKLQIVPLYKAKETAEWRSLFDYLSILLIARNFDDIAIFCSNRKIGFLDQDPYIFPIAV